MKTVYILTAGSRPVDDYGSCDSTYRTIGAFSTRELADLVAKVTEDVNPVEELVIDGGATLQLLQMGRRPFRIQMWRDGKCDTSPVDPSLERMGLKLIRQRGHGLSKQGEPWYVWYVLQGAIWAGDGEDAMRCAAAKRAALLVQGKWPKIREEHLDRKRFYCEDGHLVTRIVSPAERDL